MNYKGDVVKGNNFSTFKDYRETIEGLLLQDERLSAYAVKVVLQAMDESYKLAKLEESAKKPKVGVDLSSEL